jgi:hypothetical protein
MIINGKEYWQTDKPTFEQEGKVKFINVDDLAPNVRNSHPEWDRDRINVKSEIESFAQLGMIDPYGVEENLE